MRPSERVALHGNEGKCRNKKRSIQSQVNSEWSNKRSRRENELIHQRINFIVIPIDRPAHSQCSNFAGTQCIDRDSPARHLPPPGSGE
jgi:hypothetical protein